MRTLVVATFLLAALASVLLVPPVYHRQQRYQQEAIGHAGRLPAPLAHALVIEYDGVAADYLFLKTVTYIGYKIQNKQHLTAADWQTVLRMLNLITDLDPRFWDPYLLGEMMLPWDANMLKEADVLLQKSARNRPTDYRPLFYLGFNAFYFEKNAKKAAPYLRRAAELPGAPPYFKGLAARFSLYSHETKLGIAFLKNILQTTTSRSIQEYLQKRLTVLEDIELLKEKIHLYEKEHHTRPANLQALVKAGLLSAIPEDPYGGEFIILPNGRVYTTSKMVPVGPSARHPQKKD